MPPKRRGRGGGAGRGRGRGKRTKKPSTSEDERSASDNDFGVGFDKSSLQRDVKYDFKELMADPSFNHPEFIHTMDPSDLNLKYYEESGLEHPIHFRCDPKLIGMTVPDKSFSVDDVLELVGGNRIIEVVKVKDQGSVKMSLQEFIDFYKLDADKREVLYNVLSLEFSLTPLEDMVKSPSLVRQIDWVGNKWPDALRQRWIGFNERDKKLYTPHHTFPKVQNYCLMSVADCYTDFHIDFSGTSVWYHVLKGKKVFWLIPPTETNFMLYQEFIQTVGDTTFFGRSVEKCHMAVLEPGDTMLIPSGWIHAVYTPDDSLVFGGNFLHSLSCKMQIRVYQCENRLNITRKFRLPYNEELIFYVLADYVKKWTGREYVRPLRIEDSKLDYVGEKWKEAGGHLKKIEYSTFEKGVKLTNEMINGEHNESIEKPEVKLIAMHAENTIYARRTMKSVTAAADSSLEPEAEEIEEDEATEARDINNAEESGKLWDEEVDSMALNNPLVFFKNSKHDFIHNKCVPDHKLPIGHEPPIEYIEEELEKISPRLLAELDALGAYLKKKAKVEVAEGICQPASLLHAFITVLKKRKAQLEGKSAEEFEKPPIKRKCTRSTVESGAYEGFSVATTSSNIKVDDFPENFLETEEDEEKKEMNGGRMKEEIKEDVKEEEEAPEKPSVPEPARRSSRRASTKASEAIKEEVKEEEEIEKMEENGEEKEEKEENGKTENGEMTEEEEDKNELTWREKMEKEEKNKEKTPVLKEKKAKLTKEEKKEKKKKDTERKRKSTSLDAALNAAHGTSKSKKKKPEKPQYIGGLPVAPIQTDPVVANPYNYDPKMEMIKLGTGQLKSAYRKTKNNIELRIEKNLYKLEPKRKSTEGGEEEEGEEQERMEEGGEQEKEKKVETAMPISIDIFDVPTSSKKKKETTGKLVDLKRKGELASPVDSSPKPKIASPSPVAASIFSPGSQGRRRSETSTTIRKSTFTNYVSRQDRMIAESASPIATTTRHSSFSEKRPIGLPSTPQIPPKTTNETIYTPSAPPIHKTSWMSSTEITTTDRMNDSIDEPIDVVTDTIPSPRTPPLEEVNSPIHEITTPPGGLREGGEKAKKNNNEKIVVKRRETKPSNGRRHSDALMPVSSTKKSNRIPASEALQNLKTLIAQLKQLNEAD